MKAIERSFGYQRLPIMVEKWENVKVTNANRISTHSGKKYQRSGEVECTLTLEKAIQVHLHCQEKCLIVCFNLLNAFLLNHKPLCNLSNGRQEQQRQQQTSKGCDTDRFTDLCRYSRILCCCYCCCCCCCC